MRLGGAASLWLVGGIDPKVLMTDALWLRCGDDTSRCSTKAPQHCSTQIWLSRLGRSFDIREQTCNLSPLLLFLASLRLFASGKKCMGGRVRLTLCVRARDRVYNRSAHTQCITHTSYFCAVTIQRKPPNRALQGRELLCGSRMRLRTPHSTAHAILSFA